MPKALPLSSPLRPGGSDRISGPSTFYRNDYPAMPGAMPVTPPEEVDEGLSQHHELPASAIWDDSVDLSYRAGPVESQLLGSEPLFDLPAESPDQRGGGRTEEPPATQHRRRLRSSEGVGPVTASSSSGAIPPVVDPDPRSISKTRSSKSLTKADMPLKSVIAVFGLTGTGKSSFISKLTGQEIKIGHGQKSCTTEIQEIQFRLGSHIITLVDTPGFDDTHRQDTEILREIASWMEHAYEEKMSLTGVIYLHRITDNRMSGTSLKNLRLLRSLCGTDALSNVMLTSTMWDKLAEEAEGINRESELLTESTFWGQLKENGADIWRYNNTRDDAIALVESLIQRKPVVLQIQRELVVQKKKLIDTSAGQSVNDTLKRLEKQHTEEIEALKQEMARNHQKANYDLQEEIRELQNKINDVEKSKQRLRMPVTRRKWWHRSWRCAGCHRRLTKDADDPAEGECPGCHKMQRFV